MKYMTSLALQPLPTAISVATRLALSALTKAGVDADEILGKCGLAVPLSDRISAANQARLLEQVADALSNSALGLSLADQANPREFGVLFYVCCSANNVRGAIRLMQKYFDIANEGVKL